MSTSRYVAKKLQPFITSRADLTQQFEKLEKEQKEEERLNDQYFDQLGKLEKEYDTLAHILEDYGKKTVGKQNGDSDQDQNLDSRIEKAVIETLGLYLLAGSRKEQLEALQEREMAKKQTALNLTLGKTAVNDLKILEDSNELNEEEYGYYVYLFQYKIYKIIDCYKSKGQKIKHFYSNIEV